MRHALWPVIALALLLGGCGDEDAEREDAAQAAIDEIRDDYETREATIENALETAAEWRGKDGVPELNWGDRPAPGFRDERYDKYNKEANGRVFELGDDGDLNTDHKTFLGLFVDRDWRGEMAKVVSGERSTSDRGVQARFEDYMTVRYLCLLVTDEFRAPVVNETASSFTPGLWNGRALYFDLEKDELIGGQAISVANSTNIDFGFKTDAEPEQRQKNATHAAEKDLRTKLMEQARNP